LQPDSETVSEVLPSAHPSALSAPKKSSNANEKTPPSAVGTRVLDALHRLGCKGIRQGEIRDWLLSRSATEQEAADFAHTISQWKGGNPSVASLIRLADLTGLSVDELLGRITVPRTTGSGDRYVPGQGWFANFLSQSQQIRCYVVSAEARVLEQMRTSAAASVLSESEKVELARGWTREFQVRDASSRMRVEHSLTGPLSGYRLQHLLEARMHWTEEVPVHGTLLAKLARHQAYHGIFEALCHQRIEPFNRFPCMYKNEEGNKSLQSIRVGTDPIPTAEQPSWIICYHRGPPILEDDLAKLLTDAKALPT
jgi:hypothetical protein